MRQRRRRDIRRHSIARYQQRLPQHKPKLTTKQTIAGEVEREITNEKKLGDYLRIQIQHRRLTPEPVGLGVRAEHGLYDVENENGELAGEEEEHNSD